MAREAKVEIVNGSKWRRLKDRGGFEVWKETDLHTSETFYWLMADDGNVAEVYPTLAKLEAYAGTGN